MFSAGRGNEVKRGQEHKERSGSGQTDLDGVTREMLRQRSRNPSRLRLLPCGEQPSAEWVQGKARRGTSADVPGRARLVELIRARQASPLGEPDRA